MNFMEAYKADQAGEKVFRVDNLGIDVFMSRAAVGFGLYGYKKEDIEATNWEIKRKQMFFDEAMKHFFAGETVENDMCPGTQYTMGDCRVVKFHIDEIKADTWFIVEEE